MVKNYKSHKRQKSSILNQGYFYPDQQGLDHHQPPPSHIPSPQIPQLSHPQLSSAQLSNLGVSLDLYQASGTGSVPAGSGDHTSAATVAPSIPPNQLSSPTHSGSTQSPTLDQSATMDNNATLDSSLYEPMPYYNFPPQERSNFFYPVSQGGVYNPIDPNPFASSSSGATAPAPSHPHPVGYIPSSVDGPLNPASISSAPLESGHPSSYNIHPQLQHPNTLPQTQSMHPPLSSALSSPSVPSSPSKSIRSRSHSRKNSKSHIKSHSRTSSRSTQRPVALFLSPGSKHHQGSTMGGHNLSSQSLPPLALPKHKSNLSISSHFNLFNLNDHDDSRPDDQVNNRHIFQDLLAKLLEVVDQQSVNNYLLFVLYKLKYPIPLDDFYNALYNEQDTILLNFNTKIDKTFINSNYLQHYLDIIGQILDLFKDPDRITKYVQNHPQLSLPRHAENHAQSAADALKSLILSNINYHELLRTFLAIKILQDMLIELPKNSDRDTSSFNIPRLSLYKTYYIICQTLLLKYPSSLTSNNDHHKLILGQSKLGKLIKLVYPHLVIKRLGSRGESKYNYLGVVWNENIINDEVKKLCDDHELIDLNRIFESQYKSKFQSLLSEGFSDQPIGGQGSGLIADLGQSLGNQVSSQLMTHGEEMVPGPDQLQSQIQDQIGGAPGLKIEEEADIPLVSHLNLQATSTSTGSEPFTMPFRRADDDFNYEYTNPVYSFITNNLMLPKDFDFIMHIEAIKNRIYQETTSDGDEVDSGFIKMSINKIMEDIFLNNYDNNGDFDLGNLFIEKFNEITQYVSDLKIYLLILLELAPILLLIRPVQNFKVLKVNLINFLKIDINNENINTNNFIKFKLILKNLINLNDLLIHLVKLLFKDQNFVTNLSDLFNFQSEDLMDNLINSLISFNFNPDLILNYSFLNNQIDQLKNFYLIDLLTFLKTLFVDSDGTDTISTSNSNSNPRSNSESNIDPAFEPDSHSNAGSRSNSTSSIHNGIVLNNNEYSNLINFLNLINNLINKFNHLPVLILINFINLISNDHLKFVYFKNLNIGNNSFNHWWSINCFIQDYLNLVGELIGLYNEIFNIL